MKVAAVAMPDWETASNGKEQSFSLSINKRRTIDTQTAADKTAKQNQFIQKHIYGTYKPYYWKHKAHNIYLLQLT